MRVLVTGAGGFVGPAVVHRLVEAGHDVAAVTRRAWRERPANVRSIVADVLDLAAVTRAIDDCEPEGVCHLAALTRVRDSFQEPVRYFAVNVTGTLHVLQALAELADRTGRTPRLVFGSSAAVYGLVGEQPIAEDTPSLPTTPLWRLQAGRRSRHWVSGCHGRAGSREPALVQRRRRDAPDRG